MSKKILIALFVLTMTSMSHAEDPFSRSFSAPITNDTESSLTSPVSQDDGIHPMVRYDVSKYFVKGVIISENGSLAIVSIPGAKDYFLFLGDPLGNNLHTIKDITQNFVILGKSNGEDVSISVSNPIQSSAM